MLKRLIEYIKHGIWQKKESDIDSRKERWFTRQFKVIIFTIKGFAEHNIAVRSAALTFYTIMSIVPIAALIFAVVKGFGLDTNFLEYLYLKFPEYSSIIDNISTFAEKLLYRTRSGVLAITSFVVLLWAVMRVFGNIEMVFNNIWEIKKKRSLARKFSDYVAVVFIAPILWVISNSISLYVKNILSYYTDSWFLELIYSLGSLVLVWVMFTFVYYVMPNTKVKMKSAFSAGIFAGTIFQIFQISYFFIQARVSNYNAIYGSFAALPLFLIWLQASWQILLFGAELSFAYQNIGRYEHERESLHMSLDHKRKVLVATMVTIVKHFLNNQGPVGSESVAAELEMPVRIVRDVIFDMENAGLIAAVKNETKDKINLYIPSRDVHDLTVYDVVRAVDIYGSSHIVIDDVDEMKKICEIFDKFDAQARTSALDIKLTELI